MKSKISEATTEEKFEAHEVGLGHNRRVGEALGTAQPRGEETRGVRGFREPGNDKWNIPV